MKRLVRKANQYKMAKPLKESAMALLKHCIDTLCEKAQSIIKEMRPADNSVEEINTEAYNIAYEELYDEEIIDNIAKENKTTIDDVVLCALSHFGDKLIGVLEKAYIQNLGGNYMYAKRKHRIRKQANDINEKLKEQIDKLSSGKSVWNLVNEMFPADDSAEEIDLAANEVVMLALEENDVIKAIASETNKDVDDISRLAIDNFGNELIDDLVRDYQSSQRTWED